MRNILVKTALATVTCTAIGLGVLDTHPAQAADFNFSYTNNEGDTISGELVGTLQGDNNTVIVSQIISNSFDGTPGPALTSLDSFSDLDFGTGIAPTVSLNGLVVDIVAFDASRTDAFGISTNPNYGSPVYASLGFYGNISSGEPYNPANFTLTPVAQAPEPLTTLGSLTAAGLGVVLRRRQKQLKG